LVLKRLNYINSYEMRSTSLLLLGERVVYRGKCSRNMFIGATEELETLLMSEVAIF